MKFTQDYKENLLKLDADNSDDLISNGSKDHAQALIYQFLEGAKKSINITSTSLSVYNTDKIVRALGVALKNNITVKVLIDDYQGSKLDGNRFLAKCLQSNACTVKTYDKPLKAHIVTRDKGAFRYCDNPGSNIAVASFNHPNIVKNAEEKIFGDFFEQQPDYTTA